MSASRANANSVAVAGHGARRVAEDDLGVEVVPQREPPLVARRVDHLADDDAARVERRAHRAWPDCWLYLFHDHLLLSAVTSYEKMYVEVYGLRLPLSFDYVVMDQ